jgi:hypothetical protein
MPSEEKARKSLSNEKLGLTASIWAGVQSTTAQRCNELRCFNEATVNKKFTLRREICYFTKASC